MSDKLPSTVTCRFAYNHIESDGKYVNLTEALEAMAAKAGQLGHPAAAKRIVDDCYQLILG